MQYARRGEVNVEAVVHVAHERAKHPLATGKLHRCIECHRTEGHQHVGHRQWDNKVICYNAVGTRKTKASATLNERVTTTIAPHQPPLVHCPAWTANRPSTAGTTCRRRKKVMSGEWHCICLPPSVVPHLNMHSISLTPYWVPGGTRHEEPVAICSCQVPGHLLAAISLAVISHSLDQAAVVSATSWVKFQRLEANTLHKIPTFIPWSIAQIT